MRPGSTGSGHRRAQLAAVIVWFGVSAAPGWASTLFMSSAAAPLGESANLCVALEGGENRIAGLQANLVWDDACMTPTDARRLCRADPATGKSVQSALQGRGALKAILISFSDVNPIPDGPLFCCAFTAVGPEGTRCPPVQLTQIVGSTPTGTRINDIRPGNAGVFTILTPESEPVPVDVPQQRVTDDGCSIDGAKDSTRLGISLLLAVPLLILLGRSLQPAEPGGELQRRVTFRHQGRSSARRLAAAGCSRWRRLAMRSSR